jgi:hypothetical protein
MHKFSYYKGGIKKKTPSADLTIQDAIDKIRSEVYKNDIEKLRNEQNKDTKTVRKSLLDYFTFSGTFKTRSNEGLVKHSGILCLDFDGLDNVPSVKDYFTKWEYTLAAFISPTGSGLKVLVQIDPKKHLETFLDLERVLLIGPIPLTLDKSGKDVCRACFVSYDPDVYFNPKSVVYKVAAKTPSVVAPTDQDKIESKTESVEIKLKASEQFTYNKNLQRAQHVADQIELKSIDITGDYEDWQLIAFSLATFGEDGRDIFHTVSRQYGEYDFDKAEEKFTDAINKGQFKTPAKFFSLAKNYGLQIQMPKTISEAKEEVTYKQLLEDDEQVNDHIAYGIYQKGGTYWSMNEKNKQVEVTNFKMRIIYHVETSDDEAYRLIQIKNIFGLDVVIKMNTDNFVSAGSFKKEIARKGNFIFKGTDADLCRLQDKLQREERKTDLIKQLGYNRRYNFYAWANGIFDCNLNKFIPADELGIVEHYKLNEDGEMIPLNFFIPAMASMFKDKEDLYVNDKRFLLVENEITFKEWSELFCKVYGHNGQMGLVYYIMALFSDIIFKDMSDRFPMLNVYGQKGTGKGTLIESMMKLFGQGQKQLMLGGASTVVGFMRKSGQYSNAIVWLDEYKNNLKPQFIESLKNLYDRIGYERGKKDNTFQTESTRIDSAVIVSGQEMPIVEEALFSRFIALITTKPHKTEETIKNYNKLKDLEANGLSSLTVYLLRHRTSFSEKFRAMFNIEQRELSKAVNNSEVDDRFINNYASMIASFRIISEVETLPFNVKDFRDLCKKTLMDQFYVLRGSDSLGKWWNIVETLFEQGIIQDERHFKISDKKLYIRVQDVYQHYTEAMAKRKDVGVLDEATLKNYLQNDPKAYLDSVKKFFGGTQKWCLVFKYQELGINLLKAASAPELRQLYKNLGLEYEEETGIPAAEATPVAEQIEIPLKQNLNINPSVEFNNKPTSDEPF